MSSTDEQAHDRGEAEKTRKEYIAPSIVESASFETLALSCAKIDTLGFGFCSEGGQFGSTPASGS